MTVFGWVVAALRRVYHDRAFAQARARPVDPYLRSRTLREHYAYFVWELGMPPATVAE